MFKKRFVIHGFPRTGATFVKGNLSQYFDTFVEQTHQTDFVPDHPDYTAILTRRRNVFDTLCSHFVMLHTGEMSIYSDTQYPKFSVAIEEFYDLFNAHNDFYKTIDLSHYKKVVELWYEDVINDPYYLFGKFNIAQQTSYEYNKRCPHRSQDLIDNLDELQFHYRQLVQD